jgi:hypothetical protein
MMDWNVAQHIWTIELKLELFVVYLKLLKELNNDKKIKIHFIEIKDISFQNIEKRHETFFDGIDNGISLALPE